MCIKNGQFWKLGRHSCTVPREIMLEDKAMLANFVSQWSEMLASCKRLWSGTPAERETSMRDSGFTNPVSGVLVLYLQCATWPALFGRDSLKGEKRDIPGPWLALVSQDYCTALYKTAITGFQSMHTKNWLS